jgi:hypothetical protein
MLRRLTVAALAACLLFALMPAGASAHRLSSKTTARLTSGGPTGAEGKVSSPRAACRRNRLVELFRENELDEDDPQSYGTDRTNRRGAFNVDAALLAGEYFVRVKRSRFGGEDNHICRAATSLRVRF